jgi:hypothetical protein
MFGVSQFTDYSRIERVLNVFRTGLRGDQEEWRHRVPKWGGGLEMKVKTYFLFLFANIARKIN